MDPGLITLGALITISLVSAAMWHAIVKSHLLAIVASSITVGLVAFLVYPMYRGVAAEPLLLLSAVNLSAMIAIGVGIPFKRRRSVKAGAANDA